jgi:diaminopimelate decarboxylase
MLPLLAQVRSLAPSSVQSFDIGGGLGIRYRSERPPTARRFAAAVLPHLKSLGLRILMEPGRFLVGNAGALLAKVLYVKETPVKQFLIIDGAMTELIRPALYGSWHNIVPVRKSRRPAVKVDVVGPVCESGDFLAEGRPMPAVTAGEYLAVLSAGAYGFAMASNYNSRPRPAEVLVAGRRYELVRRRECLKDLIRGE